MADRYEITGPIAQTTGGVPISQVLDAWPLWTVDLHREFGVDIETGVLRERTASWFRLRLEDLLYREGTRLNAYFYPREDKQ